MTRSVRLSVHNTFFFFCAGQWSCNYFMNYICKLKWRNQSVTIKWQKCKKMEKISLFEVSKRGKVDSNHFSCRSPEISNLSRKSEYQHKKNIAGSVTDLGITLFFFCWYIDFPCKFNIYILHIFSAIKWKIWAQNWHIQVST